ncbi:protein transport protein S31 [Vanrija albida]|uniref:Protein transport protein SEC31 n=1 Tax=Vanrija albida TaxID=181172 RepID=A0ABR3PX58_9TREE
MKLKDISRTATFAWDPSPASVPLIVTGAVAGALDESFSNDSQLEIWAPKLYESESDASPQGYRLGAKGQNKPEGSVTVSSRFNRLAWSQPGATASGRGVIAAGMETGELYLYDPVKLLDGGDAQIFKNDQLHTGPVRGLDFNPIQKNLLLSGAINAELFITDLNNPSKPIPPGQLSTKLNEITALQWNTTVSRVFAASSSSGYTSVWDLKAGKEVVSLQYGGGAAKGDVSGRFAGQQVGKRRGMSDVCWHPEQGTRLITASEDDESPIIMLWDLRNTRAPERILSGHTKGVLSVSWCKQDPDLLVSSGKDNRTLFWNPQTGDIVGELPTTSDWPFQTSWCPSNPNILATASFDGHIGIHSLQATREEEPAAPALPDSATAEDIFSSLGQTNASDDRVNVQSLTQAPKWMRRPVSATFGYGGLLASVSNLPDAHGKHQSGVVHLRQIITEDSIIERAKALDETAGDKEKLAEFASNKLDDAAWKALQTLFRTNSREDLITLLGFSKEEVATKVAEAVKKLSPAKESPSELPKVPEVKAEDEEEKEDKEKETTPTSSSAAANLFSNSGPGTPVATGDEPDFFSSIAQGGSLRNPQLDNIVPHLNALPDSSVAATIGSGPSSVRSENIGKDNTFHIYPPGESDVDKLITQALVLGDFSSAVDLCLASERFADALLLAVRGGPELLQQTQKAYFARRTMAHPFLRVFQSIVTEDLVDIVQNADLGEWRVVFVVLCTFAKEADFANLADQLGRRLQFKWQLLAASDSPENKEAAKTARQDATLCYLAARNLEHVVSIWIDEMSEEEAATTDAPRYSAHVNALQTFIEKVAVFKAATGYVDKDLAPSSSTTEAGARTYALAGLYDRFYEYADLLATQGLVDIAAKYVQQTPKDYIGTGGLALDKARERVFVAAGVAEQKPGQSSKTFGSTRAAGGPSAQKYPAANSYNSYAPAPTSFQPAAPAAYQPAPSNPYATQPTARPPPSAPGIYAPPPAQSGPYAPAQTQSDPYGAPQPPQPQQSSPYNPTGYAPQSYGSNGYGAPEPQSQYGGYQPSYGGSQPAYGGASIPPPPPRAVNAQTGEPLLPAAQRRDLTGWNDAPSLAAPKRPASAQRETPKPAAITSPFPMSEQAPSPYGAAPQGHAAPPPPGRGPPGVVPPPPKGGARPPSQNRGSPGSPPPPPPPAAIQQPFSSQPPPGAAPQSPPRGFAPPPAAARPPPPRGTVRAGPPPPGVVAGPPPRALSPLGPGGRPPQHSLGGAVSPPPPPPGARVGGPPPPGRAGPRPPSAATPPPAKAPSPPAQPRHPAGDRSHIPAQSRPVYDALSAELARVKQADVPPHVKKIVGDTDRRLNILFDELNNDAVGPETIAKLNQIVQAIGARDPNGALAIHVDLLTTATSDTSHWAPGVKQLIRLGV